MDSRVINPDPKWLEILKASGWQTTALTTACLIFLFLSHIGMLPVLPDWALLAISFAAIICGCLAFASWCSTAYKFFPIHKWFLHWLSIRRSKRGLRAYIPYMTPKENEIISYLLAKNMKTFLAEANGGHASTLLSRGIVIVLAQRGQQIDTENVPMTIPDHLWDVFMEYKTKFLHTQTDDNEPYPWRVDWMER